MDGAESAGRGTTLDEFLGDGFPRSAGPTRLPEPCSPPGLGGVGSRPAGADDPDAPAPVDQDFGRDEPNLPLPIWRCLACDRSDFEERALALWVCRACGSSEFYNSRAPLRREVSQGVWMYVPHRRDNDPSSRASESSTTTSTTSTMTVQQPWAPTSPTSGSRHGASDGEGSEGSRQEGLAESEALTWDVPVDPDTMQPVHRLSRRQRRAAAAAAAAATAAPPGRRAPGVRLPVPRAGQQEPRDHPQGHPGDVVSTAGPSPEVPL